MLELGSFGSVRGVPGHGHSYRNPRSIVDIAESAEIEPQYGILVGAAYCRQKSGRVWQPALNTRRGEQFTMEHCLGSAVAG